MSARAVRSFAPRLATVSRSVLVSLKRLGNRQYETIIPYFMNGHNPTSPPHKSLVFLL